MGVMGFKTKLSDLKSDQYLRCDTDFLEFNKTVGTANRYLKNFVPVFETGKPITKEDYSENGDMTEYIHLVVRNIKNGVLNLDDPIYIKEKKGEALKQFKIESGDIVVAISANCGSAFYFDEVIEDYQLTLSHYLSKFKVNPENLNPRLLVYYLNSKTIQKYFRATETGKTQKNLSKTYLRELPIFLPADVGQQRELLNSITPIENEISKLKQQVANHVNIINKVFGEAFGFDGNYYKEFGKGMTAGTQQSNPKEKSIYKVPFSFVAKSDILRVSSRFHNPKMQFLYERLHSKPTIQIKSILNEKAHRGASPQYDSDGDVVVIKTAHLRNNFIEISEDEFVNEDFYEKTLRSQVFENDVLIASTGKVSLGKVDVVLSDQDCVADSHVTVLRLNTELYKPLFLTYFLRSILGAFQIERGFTGATNQIELYPSEIENFDIPDFTLEQQTKIVETIKTQLDQQKDIDKRIEEKQQAINKIIEDAIKQEQN